MNAIEAILNFWQDKPQFAHERDLLYRCVVSMRVAINSLPNQRDLVARQVRPALQVSVADPLGQRPRGTHGQMVCGVTLPARARQEQP